MKSVYCVLRTGRFRNARTKVEYNAQQVQWLKRQCDEHLKGVDFYCLTDLDSIDGVNTIPLKHNWPGWWSKIELFRFDEVFYIDLDTVIINDIRYMLDLKEFHALRNLSGHRLNDKVVMGSGLMSWTIRPQNVYESFTISQIPQYTKRYNRWGDQGYIYDRLAGQYNAFQDAFPNRIHSYKFDGIDKENPPGDIVIFHGKPKPWDSGQKWVPPLVL